ncbi:MAG: tRNA 2-thiouridine(34) synthase MnmA [Candidatus Wildermuthbacteria bacterium RIFCSPHIGHO2_01_FULL_45_20]|nr:MAG: tRNA 2-thiouridine(34) synthase MnmA [Candidatus Wildermuthbacteria bacterium RIFCSPHIGHO2_01_FULL_45_20]
MARIWNKHKQSNTPLKRKVFVAMSGGVDSSVSAALLKKAGFDVIGIFMKCWSADDPMGENCTSSDDERMARLAAHKIGIPFYSLNFIKEYKERVVNYMLEGYRKGITPNPDVMCNKHIKFGLFFEKAMRLGADFVATGHYARLSRKFPISSSRVPKSRKQQKETVHILAARDENKDQSYFLSMIDPAVLLNVMFPIGEYTKPQVRELAKKFGLPNAERKDSQGICFVGKVDFSDFLKHYIPPKKGEIHDMEGNVLGEHEGAVYYTIGQRKGLGLAGGPYFVVDKDVKRNIVEVSKDENDLLKSRVKISHINWFAKPKKFPANLHVKLRYRSPMAEAVLEERAGEKHVLNFMNPQRAVTKGQFAALYDNNEMIGAGVIS